jgi:hypothetical protein
MKVQILKALKHGRLRANPGELVSVDDQTGARWIDQGLAKEPKIVKPPKKEEEDGNL